MTAPHSLMLIHISVFIFQLNILDYVGLPINMKKVEKPNYQITCLGIQIEARTSHIQSAPGFKPLTSEMGVNLHTITWPSPPLPYRVMKHKLT